MPEVLQQFSEGKGEKPLTNVQWRHVEEKKAYRGRVWRMMGEEPYVRGMWEYRVFRLIGGVYTIIGAFCQKTQARATLPIG